MKLTRISAQSDSWPTYFASAAWPVEEPFHCTFPHASQQAFLAWLPQILSLSRSWRVGLSWQPRLRFRNALPAFALRVLRPHLPYTSRRPPSFVPGTLTPPAVHPH